jgi:5-methylcytosine-specific restriction endonuclease McrA
MLCRCGNATILALGLCSTCYTLKRQDEEYFGGLREQVLERDGYRCRGCGAPGRTKRSITVHHRVPGVSKLELMISLCPGCHAKVERTKMVLSEMNPLLLKLWRERHRKGQEQVMLNFTPRDNPADSAKLAEWWNARANCEALRKQGTLILWSSLRRDL